MFTKKKGDTVYLLTYHQKSIRFLKQESTSKMGHILTIFLFPLRVNLYM